MEYIHPGAAFVIGLGLGVTLSKYLFTKDKKSDSGDYSEVYWELPSGFGNEPYKMVFAVRTDLKMSKGKAAVQCSHATLSAYKASIRVGRSKAVKAWERTSGQKKISLKCDSEEHLFELQAKARNRGLIAVVIRDAGRTEVEPNTPTVLAIGPDTEESIDVVTGSLKIY